MLVINIFANIHSFRTDNDAYASKKDAHYTGGFFYTIFDKNSSKAISLSTLAFTPKNKDQNEKILNDLPYAGFSQLNFLYYKYNKKYFHEFGINIGFIGPSNHTKEIQSELHKIINARESKGWHNQLKDQPTAGISYNYAIKTETKKLYKLKYNWTNNFRIDLGNFYSGVLISSTIKIGNHFPNTFSTSGNFIGGEESDLVNYIKINNFNWAISFSIFVNKVNNYYIIDEAINQGYSLDKLSYMSGEQVQYDIYYKGLQYFFKIKSVYIHNNRLFSNENKQWGELGIIWEF